MALVSQFLSVADEKLVMLYSTKSNARMIGHRPQIFCLGLGVQEWGDLNAFWSLIAAHAKLGHDFAPI